MSSITNLMDRLWQDYTKMNPDALKIHDLFESQGEKVSNDHVAFRTYNLPQVGLKKLEEVFLKNGYVAKGDYHFEEKKLYAKHYEHSDSTLPKIFISELLVEKFDPETQAVIKKAVAQVPASLTSDPHFCTSGRPWSADYQTYQKLLTKSEYAAWMYSHGFRVNHFTVLINSLKKFKTVQAVNELLKKNNYKLNSAGGEIKGSADVYLEQSSTMAYQGKVKFSDGDHVIPTCYYEFALRYPMSNGKLYQGFVEKSADKIFESTNKN